jgi:Ca2+:H+ antiporter
LFFFADLYYYYSKLELQMGSVSADDKMDTDFDEETPFSFTSPSSSSSSAPPSKQQPHTFHFDSSAATLPKSSSSSSFFNHPRTRRISRSIYIVLIKAKVNILLPFGPLAIFLHYFTGKHVWVFFFALLGIAPLAERLGYATEYVTLLPLLNYTIHSFITY